MLMHEPPHPGEVLKDLYLKPLGLSITKAAGALMVSRKALSSLVNGRVGISPEMAVRLSVALDTTPELWMNLQVQFDLWRVRQSKELKRIKKLNAA